MPNSKKYFASRKAKINPLTSMLLVFPLLIFYELGVLFTNVMNGADFITQTLLHFIGLKGFLIVQASISAIFFGIVLYLRRKHRFDFQVFVPVLIESGIYALTMGTFIIFVMTDLLGIDPRLSTGLSMERMGILDKIVLSIGAGVFEEIVFRLMILTTLVWVFDRVLDFRRWLAIVIAFLVSSLLFSAAHHIGPYGEAWRIGAFTYRTLAGLFFASLFQFRGFPISVYTHAMYDIYVMLLR